MELLMLGTGHAVVTECYNTCFLLKEEDRFFLVDGGGGAALLRQLKALRIPWMKIRNIFLTHKHLDHLTGVLWLLRLYCQTMNLGVFEGEVSIYAHEDLCRTLRILTAELFTPAEARFVDDRIHLIAVKDGETRTIIGQEVTFFDIGSAKERQFGFSMKLPDGKKLTCCGDEPCHDCEKPYAQNSKWLLHEAFCLASQADIFKPYEKHHSTAADAAKTAKSLGVENLILYHTEDQTLAVRKAQYTAEAAAFFDGGIYVPEDLETISL